jgi:hypothetical protein
MSDAIFPTLPGRGWSILRTPQHSTRIQTAVSGKETRARLWATPIWVYELTFDVLREEPGLAELQTLAEFFAARSGAYDTFLFLDPGIAGYANIPDRVFVAGIGYFRCRFEEDSLTYEEFLYRWHTCQSVKFRTVK